MTQTARLLTVGVAAAAAAVYSALIGWFAWTDVYNAHFFDRGGLLLLYNLLRIVLAVAIAWLVYAPGAGALALVAGKGAVGAVRPGERYALGFLAGAGLWHAVLFGMGFAGLYTRSVAFGVTVAVVALSAPHLAACCGEARRLLPVHFGGDPRNARFMGIFAVVAALFVCVKALYPGGGNDYFNHYFYYYVDVIRADSLMPNEAWYHFFYSKGCGLFFLGMLLSDLLAPPLVTASFIFAGALIVALIVARVAPGTALPWVGAILYVALLVFTPNPPDLVGAAGWGELAKQHELVAPLFLGLFWVGARLAEDDGDDWRLWLTAAVAATAAMVLVTTEMAVVVGMFCVGLAGSGWATRRARLGWTMLACATVAGALLILILAINYALTGIPDDQLLLYLWPIVDLEKVARWGVLNEVLWLHFGMTGFVRQSTPLGWAALYQLYRDFRLDLWWPVVAFAAGGAVLAIAAGEWRGRLTTPARRALLATATVFATCLTVIALLLGTGPLQWLSFFRFASFAYAPTLCAALLLCVAFPYRSRRTTLAAGVVIAAVVASGETGKHGREMATGIPILTGDAVSFVAGGMSLEEAYGNPGWPKRYAWGGIYPAMDAVWKIVGRGTPVYSLVLQSYCMLPDCHELHWHDTRTVPDFQTVLFGTPDEAVAAIKRAGIDYFFYSTELADLPDGISSPIVVAPIFSPDAIAQYFGVKWTDGTSYLLTWRDRGERPLDAAFLATYRRQVENAPVARSFPLADWRSVFAHFRDKGLHPFRLPWCLTCGRMAGE